MYRILQAATVLWQNLKLVKEFLFTDHTIVYRLEGLSAVIGSPYSCGIDIKLSEGVIPEQSAIMIPLGLYIDKCSPWIKPTILSRSSASLIWNLDIPVGSGDSDYRGEYKLVVRNTSNEKYYIAEGTRLCQIVFQYVLPPQRAKCLTENINVISRDRYGEGFGSSNAYVTDSTSKK